MNAKHSAETICHYTPPAIVEAARATLGGRIELDPASDTLANSVVQAADFYGDSGLERPWFGPLFVNPPGYDRERNPQGAAAWWAKLMMEWEDAGRAWDAVFVGFSLELLQTTQTYATAHPTKYPTCFFAKRIAFMVSPAARLATLHRAWLSTTDARRRATLQKKIDVAANALSAGQELVAGDSPTHGNFVTCVTVRPETAAAFRANFAKFGVVT